MNKLTFPNTADCCNAVPARWIPPPKLNGCITSGYVTAFLTTIVMFALSSVFFRATAQEKEPEWETPKKNPNVLYAAPGNTKKNDTSAATLSKVQVGIGTASPSGNFHVVGKTVFQGTVNLYGTMSSDTVNAEYAKIGKIQGGNAQFSNATVSSLQADTLTAQNASIHTLTADSIKTAANTAVVLDSMRVTKIIADTSKITTLSVDSFLSVKGLLKIGDSSMYLSSFNQSGVPQNSIYTNIGNLLIQSSTYNTNTVINANNTGRLTVGNASTLSQGQKLDVYGGGRFRRLGTVAPDNTLTRIVAVDANGILNIRDAASLTGATGAQGPQGPQGAAGANGTNGTNGLQSLVKASSEPAGTNCTTGGQKIESGLDTDNDGVLDAGEITTTSYVCNGATGPQGVAGATGATGATGQQGPQGAAGANGTNGTNGLQSLVKASSEPAGTNCTTGGQKIESGLDTDNDGVLDAGEITATNYVCNGAAGPQGSAGATGATGPQGPAGNSCPTPTLSFNNTGTLSITDCQGATTSTGRAWMLNGNAGTNPGTNPKTNPGTDFIGTTDTNAFVIRTGIPVNPPCTTSACSSSNERVRITAVNGLTRMAVGLAHLPNGQNLPAAALDIAGSNSDAVAGTLSSSVLLVRGNNPLTGSVLGFGVGLTGAGNTNYSWIQPRLDVSVANNYPTLAQLSLLPLRGRLWVGASPASSTLVHPSIYTLSLINGTTGVTDGLVSINGTRTTVDAAVPSPDSSVVTITGSNNARVSYALYVRSADTAGVANPILAVMNNGRVGIGTVNPGHTFQLVNDDAAKLTTSTWTVTSDIRIKKDTSSFTDGLEVLKQIHPVNFKYNGKTGINDTNSTHIGIIAQQIHSVAPYTIGTYAAQLDSTDTLETELLSFNAGPLLYVTINSIKELAVKDSLKTLVDSTLQAKVQQQDSVIRTLQQQITQCCATGSYKKAENIATLNNDSLYAEIAQLKKQLQQIEQSLSQCCFEYKQNNNTFPPGENTFQNKDSWLEQNIPNPFTQNTTIKYYVPGKTTNASIIIYDLQGKEIKKFENLSKGTSSVIISGGELYAGMFIYALIVDGKATDTKTMVLTK